MKSCHALNYTSACIPGLTRYAEVLAGNKMPWSSLAVQAMIKVLSTAQHFVLPDNGRLLDDGLRGLRNRPLRLPYPAITVEYFVDQSDQSREGSPCSRRIAIAQETTYAALDALFKSFGMPLIPRTADSRFAICVNAISWMDQEQL